MYSIYFDPGVNMWVVDMVTYKRRFTSRAAASAYLDQERYYITNFY